jgi:hypothetical protein
MQSHRVLGLLQYTQLKSRTTSWQGGTITNADLESAQASPRLLRSTSKEALVLSRSASTDALNQMIHGGNDLAITSFVQLMPSTEKALWRRRSPSRPEPSAKRTTSYRWHSTLAVVGGVLVLFLVEILLITLTQSLSTLPPPNKSGRVLRSRGNAAMQTKGQTKGKTLFPNAELNLLSPGSGCPLQAGTGHGLPGRAPGRC